jgi:small subunit ribosomal protein S4
MARHHGPKARINRRLSTLIYETAGATRALERRENPPGMHVKGRKLSNWGIASAEKQKIKHYYGLGERQLRRYYHMVVAKKGDTGAQMLALCERRLDNVIRRAGLTKTRPQARQGIVHGHFYEPIYNLYKSVVGEGNDSQTPDWITMDPQSLRVTMVGLPGDGDVSLPVNVNVVVEFLAR